MAPPAQEENALSRARFYLAIWLVVGVVLAVLGSISTVIWRFDPGVLADGERIWQMWIGLAAVWLFCPVLLVFFIFAWKKILRGWQ